MTAMGNTGYNPASKPETIPALVRSRNDATHRANGPESAVNEQVRVALTVSEFSSPQARRAWRRQFGHFVAQETGTLYKRELAVYDQKPREKPARVQSPLTDGDVVRERANFREDLGKPTSPERSKTLEGIYHWLESYKSLTPEEKAELEKRAKAEGGGDA